MKLIATIGPNSMDKNVLHNLIDSGVNVLRLNFSHFREEAFKQVVYDARSIKRDILIMGDLCGKKIRIYEGIKETYRIVEGEDVLFCGKDAYGILDTDSLGIKVIPLNIEAKYLNNKNIKNISMKDGTINFKIVEINGGFLRAIVKKSAVVRAGKGFNIPNIVRRDIPLTAEDKEGIKWAVENKLDIICQSYVESKKDIDDVKRYVSTLSDDVNKFKFYGKIETSLGMSKCKDIMDATDGIVIGRGDLVPECGILEAVKLEFSTIKKLRLMKGNKDIIMATHLLDSMKDGSNVILPEVESIYTFIKLGVTGFMLAAETSVSNYSHEISLFMRKVIELYS